ncbi:MAG: PqiC family protein [Oceanipulchritudo sp.]
MKTRPLTFILLVALSFLCGCTGLEVLEPQKDTTRFYILETPFDPDRTRELAPEGPRVYLGGGSIAKHLQDSRLALRSPGSNEIVYADQHRWAEPLADGVVRILVTSLSRRLGSPRVSLQRFAAGSESDYQVGFHIHKLGGEPGKAVRLHASWWVQEKEKTEPVLHETLLEESLPAEDTSHATFVRGLQNLIVSWADEIAAALEPEDES